MVFVYRAAPVETVHYLEYIQSVGTAYINTGVSGIYKATLDIEFSPSSARTLMGQGSGVGEYFGKDASNHPELGGDISINYDFTQRTTAVFEKTASAALLTVNDTTVQRASSTTTEPFYLFRTNSTDWENYSGEITLYSAKFEQNGNVVLDLVPCLNESGTACLYDRVTRTFFENSGSGSFTAGPDL